MTRRGRYRALSFVPPLGLAGWSWNALHQPLHAAGQAVLLAGWLITWPLLVLAMAFGLPGLAGAAVPRRWRIWWRRQSDHRPHIRAYLRRAVYAADRHRCVFCHARLDLQLDHYRPWSCGGLTSLWNLLTLCGRCNRVKSNYWVLRSGRVIYRGFDNATDIGLAARIAACERRSRRNPLRWIRAAWAL